MLNREYGPVTIAELAPEHFGNGFEETLSNLSHVTSDVDELRSECRSRQGFGGPNSKVFVALDGARVVGTVTVLLERKYSRGMGLAAHIEDVAVHPNHAGRGIGHTLVQHAVEFARAKCCYKVILDCDPALVPFYQKSGFRENGVCMRLDIA